ncbi:MAG: MFS transporter, partial [Spirochaetales bacterium]|nr:MFS transporter [Spirochaetales bacterium]
MSRKAAAVKPHYAWIVVGLSVAVTVGALGFGRFGYTVVLPGMKQTLGLDAVKAADLATGNMIGYLFFSVISGLLAARLGARAVVSFFMLVVSASMLLSGLADSYPVALVSRTLAGIGSAGANIPVMALVAVWFSPRRRGLATGIAVSGASLGLVVSGLLVPALLRTFGAEGWRQAWFLFAAFSFLVAVAGLIFLRNSPADKGLKPAGSAVSDAAGSDERSDEEPNRGENSLGQKPVPGSTRVDPAAGRQRLMWSLLFKSGPIWHLAGIYVMFGFSYVIYATFFVDYLTSEAGFG